MNSGDLCMASSMECGTLTMDEQEPLLGLLGEGEGDGGDDLQTWVDALFNVEEVQGAGSALSCASDPSPKRARRPVGGDREFTAAATQNPPQLCHDADTQSEAPESGEMLPRPCTGERATLAMSILVRPLSPSLESI